MAVRTMEDFFDRDELQTAKAAGYYVNAAGNVTNVPPSEPGGPEDPVVPTPVPTPEPLPGGISGAFGGHPLTGLLAGREQLGIGQAGTSGGGFLSGLAGLFGGKGPETFIDPWQTETDIFPEDFSPFRKDVPTTGDRASLDIIEGIPEGTAQTVGRLTEDQMSRIIARIWNGEQPHQFMAGADESQIMLMVAAHTIYIDNQAAMELRGYDAAKFLNDEEDRVRELEEGKEKWAYQQVLNDLKIKKISLEMEEALLEAQRGREDRKATAQFRADQLANEATKLATEQDRLNEQIRANQEAERMRDAQMIQEANRFQAAQVREDVRAERRETFDLSMFNLGADLQRDLATERSNLDTRLATEAADLRRDLAQLGFDEAEATRISNESMALQNRNLQESLANKARALEDRKIALEKELRNRGYDEQAADRVSSETISRLDRTSRERLAQLQSQTALQQSAIANPFGFGAFQALGGLPGQGRPAGQGGPADQGSNPLLAGLSELGFNIPEGTQAGTQMAPQEFFGGTIPNLGALQQLPPEALQTLMAILGLTGTSTEAFGRQAAGVTPTMQGPTARRLITSPLTGTR